MPKIDKEEFAELGSVVKRWINEALDEREASDGDRAPVKPKRGAKGFLGSLNDAVAGIFGDEDEGKTKTKAKTKEGGTDGDAETEE